MQYSGRSRTHDPSFIQSRPFLGCFIGTLSPSRLHKRSTRLSFTRRPAGASVGCCREGASLHLATRRQPGGSHIDRTDAPAQSCQQPSVPRRHAPVAIAAAWIDASPRHGKRDVQKPSSGCAHDQCRNVDARSSEVSRCGLLQDQFVQGQVRNRTPKALVLFLKTL